MYNQFFGFKQAPFSLTPDTDQFVSLRGHLECFEVISYALSTGEGFVKVVGEVGTGKTIICRKLLQFLTETEESRQRYVALYIPNPLLSPTGLFRALANELGIELQQAADRDQILEQINQRLISIASDQKSIVIIVDEAQALPEETLEALRLITNLETEKQKLVQIVLFGQTELDEILSRHEFRQLRQRITFSCKLLPLAKSAAAHYINHRVMTAGSHTESLFSTRALNQIHRLSGGVPRLINILAHKSLLSAFSRRSKTVNPKDVKRAWQDSYQEFSGAQAKSWFWPVTALLAIFSLVLAGQLVMRAGLL